MDARHPRFQVNEHPEIILKPENSSINSTCPVCGSGMVYPFLEIPDLPVFCNVLWESRQEALHAPRASIRLALCEGCGHLYNQAFQPQMVEYSAAYENSLHFSPTFTAYASWLADTLIERYNLREKTIVEIGSGKGEFLRMLVERGNNTGFGFDPSYEPDDELPDPRLTFIRELYSTQYAHIQGHFYLSRHTLEHLPEPGQLVRALRESISSGRDAAVFVEVPDAGYMVQRASVWDIIYEHVSYFTAPSLAALFKQHGFRPRSIMSTYEGQFLCLEANPGERGYIEPDTRPFTTGALNQFAQRSREKIELWQERIFKLGEQGKTAVLWGAGSKGVTFLNMIRPNGEVPYVVDINPRKEGKYVAGTGHQIVQPDALREIRPDVIMIVNPIYRQEIEQVAEGLGLAPEYLVA